jgi:hypothetical protein
MDSPVAIAKSAIQPGRLIGLAIGSLVIFAILDLAGWTDWIIYPVSTFRARFAAK